MDSEGNIAYWPLTEMRDVYGNRVEYTYQKVHYSGLVAGMELGQQMYISQIHYTSSNYGPGEFNVRFNLDDATRKDVMISGRKGFKEVTANRLNNIGVYRRDSLIRAYYFCYDTGAYSKTLLCGFVEIAPTISDTLFERLLGSGVLNDCYPGIISPDVIPYKFEYYNAVTPTDVFDNNVTYINTIGASTQSEFNLCFAKKGRPTALGGSSSKSNGWGGSLSAGLGFDSWLKTLSVGGNYHHNKSESNGLLTLVDLNGDGYPDQLYKPSPDASELYFRPMEKNGSSMAFGLPVDIAPDSDIDKFMRQTSKSNTWGLEATAAAEGDVAISASYEYGSSNSYTGTYFTDANGDGLIDIVDEGTIYYNKLDSSGNPSFLEVIGDTVWVADCKCSYGSQTSGDVNDSIYLPGEYLFLEDSFVVIPEIRDTLQLDAVRMWIAPYAGSIVIRDTIVLTPEYEERREIAHINDGIKFTIQHNGALVDSVNPLSTSLDTFLIYRPLTVVAGDRIYFRMESKTRRIYDQIKCNPSITYNNDYGYGSLNNSDSTLKDSDGKLIFKTRASDGFILNDRQILKYPIAGIVNIENTIKADHNLSDSVYVKIYQNDFQVPIRIDTLYFAETKNFTISNDTVSVGDSMIFEISSLSNIDWQAVNWDVHIEYTKSLDTLVQTVIDSTDPPNYSSYIQYDILPYKTIYNNSIFPTKVWQCTSSMQNAVIQPVIDTLPNCPDGEAVFTIKTTNHFVGRSYINISGGSLQASSLMVDLEQDTTYYMDFYCSDRSLAAYFEHCGFAINGGKLMYCGLHSVKAEEDYRFGPLYRGWGQFVYNKLNTGVSYIIE